MTKKQENPITLFDQWFKEAKNKGIAEPNAVNLATADKKGRPSNRMVLVKDYNEEGFVFYTNLDSKKGQNIKENPYVSMCFFWPETDKQVRIEGKVKKVSDKVADEYFDSRALKSRIGAIVSKQSQKIKENNFDIFKNSTLEAFKLLATKGIKRPDNWSGFCLVPDRVEFWQRGEFRIHKRTSYERDDKGNWNVSFLYP